jgi:hypothetical protein
VAGVLAVVADLTLGGGGRRGAGVVAELVVVAVVAVVVREAAVPSSPRWWCWSLIAAVACVLVVAGVRAVVATRRLTDPRGRHPPFGEGASRACAGVRVISCRKCPARGERSRWSPRAPSCGTSPTSHDTRR